MPKKLFALTGIILSSVFIIHKASAQIDSLNIINGKWAHFAVTNMWDSAIYYAKESQRCIKELDGELSFRNASSLANAIGQTYLFMNNYSQAYTFYKKGIAIFEAINDTSVWEYRNALLYFGVLCNNMGSYTEAEDALLKSAELFKKAGNMGQYIECLANLSPNYSDKGEYSKAESLDITIKQIIDTMPPNKDMYYWQRLVYDNLAKVYSQTGNTPKSLEYLQKIEEIFKIIKPVDEIEYKEYFHDYIQFLLDLAHAYTNVHNMDSAKIKWVEVENGLKIIKDDYLSAIMLQEKARIYTEEKKYASAILLNNQSLTIMKSIVLKKPEAYDAVILNLGALYQLTGQYVTADSIVRTEITRLYNDGFKTSYFLQQALIILCKNLMYQDKNLEAADSLIKAGYLALHMINKNFAGMPETDQLKYTVAFDEIFDLLNSLLVKDKNINNNVKILAFTLQLQRKNLVLTNQVNLLDRLRTEQDSTLASLFSSWLNTKQLLARQYSLPNNERSLAIDSLEELSETFEKQISTKGFSSGLKKSADIVQSFFKQSKRKANVEFVRFNYITKNKTASSAEYGAYILKGGDSIPKFVHLCTEKDLLNLMKNNHGELVTDAKLAQISYLPGSKSTSTLFKLIWQPISKYLQDITTVNYSPAGLLNNISFNALYSNNSYLSNIYTMHCYSSLADINDAKDIDGPPEEISLWGNIDYDSSNYVFDITVKNIADEIGTTSFAAAGIKPAEQAKNISKSPLQAINTNELAAIKKVVASNNAVVISFEKANATEDNFKEWSRRLKGGLHISTHGFYLPYDKNNNTDQLPGDFIQQNINPLYRCGLAFAGVNYYWMKGVPKLNRDDGILTGYEVAQLDLHNVQLVALSACETGLGDITATEGNIGLQRAFKLAGVKKLLVSLWQVPAKQTQELLTKFYTYWYKGQSPAEALQAAEKEMQNEHYPPYYWAGFVLIE